MSPIQRLRVPLGLLFTAVLFLLATPRPEFYWPGMMVAAMGSFTRLWASGHLKKWQTLACTGPYRWTRNPLYLGSFLAGLGFSIAAGKIWLLVTYLVMFIAVYCPVIQREEQELLVMYPSNYPSYRHSVPRFWPRWPGQNLAQSKENRWFQWSLFLTNREYRFLVSVVAAGIVLFWKIS